MDNAQDIFNALVAPFPKDFIEWRVGSTNQDRSKGMALPYIDARAVMDRLDSVVGPGNWQDRYPHANGKTVCEIGILIERDSGPEWIWKSDGAGDTDFEAEKGALSDAFKRAAVRWGIGRYLYDLPTKWVEIEQRGKSYFIKQTEFGKLDHAYEDFCHTHGWGIRAGVEVYRLLKKMVNEFVTDAASAQEFKTKNHTEIVKLPVAMQRHLMDSLDRIGGTMKEAAE